MTILLVSTIRRHIPYTEPSGFLYTIDLKQERILRRCHIIEPAFREVDNNPRGGLRGSRGIALHENQLALANASAIYRYDPQWNLLGVITHPSCAAIHDIIFQDNKLWVTSARNDVLMQFDLNGNLLRHHYLRDRTPALEALDWKPRLLLRSEQIRQGKTDFRDPRTHDLETFDAAHVNSVSILPNGDVLVSMGLVLTTKFATLLKWKKKLIDMGLWSSLLAANRRVRDGLGLRKNVHSDLVLQPAKGRSAIVRIQPDGSQSVCLTLSEITVPSHSLLLLPDEKSVYLNTTAGEVVHFEPYTGEVLSSTKVTEGFLRGVKALNKDTLILGSKGELLTFDIPTRRVLGTMRLSDDPNESVYDIQFLPEHYSLPPLSLEKHFEDLAGYKAEAMVRYGYQLQSTDGIIAP